MIMRFSLFWTSAFSAAVILGSIAIRAPDCRLAQTALVEFGELVRDLLESFSFIFRQGRRYVQTCTRWIPRRTCTGRNIVLFPYSLSQSLLQPILLRLKAKAHSSFDSYLAGSWVKPTSTDAQLQQGLSGSVVFHPNRPTATSSYEISQQVSQSTTSPPLEPVPASLDEYLQSFGLTSENQSYLGDNIPGSRSGGTGGASMFTGGSDNFFYGAVTGQWDVPFQPAQSPPLSDSEYHQRGINPHTNTMNLDQTSNPLHSGYQTTEGYAASSSSPASTRYSGPADGGFCSTPEQLSAFYPPQDSFAPSRSEAAQANFRWDSFLMTLGAQGDYI